MYALQSYWYVQPAQVGPPILPASGRRRQRPTIGSPLLRSLPALRPPYIQTNQRVDSESSFTDSLAGWGRLAGGYPARMAEWPGGG